MRLIATTCRASSSEERIRLKDAEDEFEKDGERDENDE